MLQKLLTYFRAPILTPGRVKAAYAVAVGTDLLQLVLGPFGWFFADQVLDLIAMTLTWRLLGFHPLLLPTFLLEFVPLVDMVPTWTGCVAVVIALRKRHQSHMPPIPEHGRIIDIEP